MTAAILKHPIAFLILLALVLGLAGLGVHYWQEARESDAVATLDAKQSDATITSAREAIDAAEGVSGRSDVRDIITQETKDAINSAPDDGAAGSAARDGLCQLDAYRRSADCLQRFTPSRMD